MRVGLIGAGNMARAMARGWGDPVVCTDGGSGRAEVLVAELGGEVAPSNAALAERVDLVVLCHKPAGLEAVAAEVAGRARAVASVLGGVGLDAVRAAYPGTPVLRLMPNTPVEVGRGVVCLAAPADLDPELRAAVEAHLARLGRVVELPERLVDAATAVSGVAPAYLSLVVEAQVDAGVRHGLSARQAGELALAGMAGTAALLEARGGDTLAVRREVTSPGGMTARGLAALERGRLRGAFLDAHDAVLAPLGGSR